MKLLIKPICIVIFGPQASGKGTQADKLANSLDLSIISAGNILKENRETNLEIKKYYDSGQLVPDKIIYDLIKQEVEKRKINNGIIFDGFPRNTNQISLFEKLTDELKFQKIIIIYLDVKKETVIKRVSSRRVCSKCSKPFVLNNNTDTKILCDSCGGELIKRADDNKAALEKRLNIYFQDTIPVIDYFRKKENVLEINGEPSIEEVNKDVISKLEKMEIITE